MTSKKLVNYKVIDSINHYKFGIDHDGIRDLLEILNFGFHNLRISDTSL
jgi:hypothetical protein